MIKIIQKRAIWYTLSSLLVAISIGFLAIWGLKFGIDFTGGSLLEVEFTASRPSLVAMQDSLSEFDLGGFSIQPSGDNKAILRFKEVDQETKNKITTQLTQLSGGEVKEDRFESVGPVIGSELKSGALWAIILSLIFIVMYIAWAFRKVSRPVSSWKYGLAAIVALSHDVLFTLGIFAVLGHFKGVEIDSMFVSALLTVLGFSVHDTIVVFDRTRENLYRHSSVNFEETVNKSVNDTLIRSINTSLTTLLVLLTLFFFGGSTIKYFALALAIGIGIGTYSSIFLASPLLVTWQNWSSRSRK
ncbi:protein translocase subunit SecF [Patescibacteria group bacterium]|nr:protein translocase subunit SecF [Patescibacteria group bacterium]